jgi:uncharacterized protein (TIGR03435 family)
MMAAPVVTWRVLQPAEATVYRAGSIPRATATALVTPPLPVSRSSAPSIQQTRYLSWIVLVWLAGAAAFWVRLTGGWVLTARMRSRLVRPAPPEWQSMFRRLGERIGVSRPVRLLISALVEVPVVVGWLRPVVLVPVGALSGLPPEHVEALLLHELAHIRRHDFLVNIIQSIAEALLFYHPAVWWVSGHMRAERELCCDDVAVAASGDALTYARALAQLESYRPAHGIAANGGSLSHRIARLLGESRRGARTDWGPGILAVAVLMVAAAYGVFGQADVHPAFADVSIKLNTSNWNERFRHPMGLGANSSLLLLIQFVYAVHDSPYQGHWLPWPSSQIIGGPAWMNSEGYDIKVDPGANTDPKQLWPMWETLLADRFQLRLHRETRELPVYILTAAGTGLKLPASAKDLGCVSFLPGTPPHPVPGKVDCGYIAGPYSGSTSRTLKIEGSKVRMADLARELTMVLDRTVFDRTGFTGDFDLNLSFPPGEAYRGLPGALEEQLGLKLAAAQAPVEVLVIDHAQRPALN